VQEEQLWKEPKQERSRQRFELILNTAANMFTEVGYENTTTNAIAERAAVPIGSLYQYFPSKDAVLHALAHRYLQKFNDLQQNVFPADVSSMSLQDIFDRTIDPFVAFHLEHPAFTHIFLGSEVSADLARANAELDEAVLARIKGLLLAKKPGLSENKALLMAQLVKAVVKAMFSLLDSSDNPDFHQQVIQELKTMLAGYVGPIIGYD